MIRKTKVDENVINIDGTQGNAFILLSEAKKLALAKGLNFDPIKEEMSKGDYINLLKTFDRYFGEDVTLETSNEHYLTALGVS